MKKIKKVVKKKAIKKVFKKTIKKKIIKKPVKKIINKKNKSLKIKKVVKKTKQPQTVEEIKTIVQQTKLIVEQIKSIIEEPKPVVQETKLIVQESKPVVEQTKKEIENTSGRKTWTLAKVWNQSIAKRVEKVVEPRDRMYASELGRSDIDIFLKLKGETPTNPPNERSFRKFAAGDAFEWFVRLVLVRAGIYIASQTAVKTSLPDCIEVSGKLDFIAGGVPRYTEAQEEIDRLILVLELPDVFHQISTNIIEYFKTNYPKGLDEKVIEVKSVATYGFERVEKTNKPFAGHDLQIFHYVQGLKKEGAICYICRDDLRMYEIPILPNDQKLLAKYKTKVERISKHYKDDVQPEKELLITFDEDMGRFSKNFNVEYSPFLTKLYGFERPDLYDEEVSPLIERWNRVLGRLKDKKEMTANNLEALKEVEEYGFDIKYIQSKIKIKI